MRKDSEEQPSENPRPDHQASSEQVQERSLAEEEIVAILADGSPASDGVRFVGHQIRTVEQNSAQLSTLAGILIAITTASIGNLARISASGRILIVLGTLFVLGSALVNVVSVLRISWLSSVPRSGANTHGGLIHAAISIRERKTRAYHLAVAILACGITLYAAAILVMAATAP